MKKRLILIETLHTGTGLEIMKAALAKDIEVYFITAEVDWYEGNVPTEIKQKIKTFFVDWQQTSVREQYLSHCEDGVSMSLFTQRDGYVEAVANTCQEFGLRFQSAKAIKIGRNKQLARQLLQDDPEIASPGYFHALTIDDLRKADQHLSYPIIAKPANGSGSKNITLLYEKKDLDNLIVQTQQAAPNLLLEEYKVGELISIESFTYKGCHHVLGCTNRMLTSQGEFIELGYAFPYQLEKTQQQRAETYTKKVLDKLDYEFGFCHIEYILTADDVYLVEVNPRLGGGQLGNLMSRSLGQNIYATLISALFGELEASANLFTAQAAYGCYTVYPPTAGTIKDIHGVQLAMLHPDIVDVISSVKVGGRVAPPTDMLGHAFQVIAKGETAERAMLSAYSAATTLSLKLVETEDQ